MALSFCHILSGPNQTDRSGIERPALLQPLVRANPALIALDPEWRVTPVIKKIGSISQKKVIHRGSFQFQLISDFWSTGVLEK